MNSFPLQILPRTRLPSRLVVSSVSTARVLCCAVRGGCVRDGRARAASPGPSLPRNRLPSVHLLTSPPQCPRDSPRPASTEDTSPPDTDVSASTGSTPEDVDWVSPTFVPRSWLRVGRVGCRRRGWMYYEGEHGGQWSGARRARARTKIPISSSFALRLSQFQSSLPP